MLAMLALARCCLILFFGIVVLSRPVGLCNEPGPPVSLLGAVMGLAAIPKGCFTLARLLHVNCLPLTEFKPFRRLTAAVTVCSAAFLFWLFKFQVSTGAFQPKDIFASVHLPVDARVPLKLNTKIWNNEFIDFGLLLANQFAEGKYQLTINPGDGSSPSLALEPITKPKKIVSIDSWVQAFHVFVDVFTNRFPSDAPGFMKYGSTIQDLAARCHNWRFYDEHFRFLRQTPAASLPWGTIHWELWLCLQSPVTIFLIQEAPP